MLRAQALLEGLHMVLDAGTTGFEKHPTCTRWRASISESKRKMTDKSGDDIKLEDAAGRKHFRSFCQTFRSYGLRQGGP